MVQLISESTGPLLSPIAQEGGKAVKKGGKAKEAKKPVAKPKTVAKKVVKPKTKKEAVAKKKPSKKMKGGSDDPEEQAEEKTKPEPPLNNTDLLDEFAKELDLSNEQQSKLKNLIEADDATDEQDDAEKDDAEENEQPSSGGALKKVKSKAKDAKPKAKDAKPKAKDAKPKAKDAKPKAKAAKPKAK